MADVIEVEDHLGRILAASPRLGTQRLALREAVGRTLAVDVESVHDIPAFENSSMDGFAVRFADVSAASAERPVTLEVVSDVPAGSADDPRFGPGQAVRVMTGTALPSDADTVVPFEDTVEGLTEHVPRSVTVVGAPRRQGVFVRRRADDLAAGDRVLAAGTTIGPRQLASALAAGVVEVDAVRRPRLAVLTSGSELVSGDKPLTRGQVPESSGAMLAALALEAGADPVFVGSVLDDDAAVLKAVRDLADVDVIVLTGGVSAGAYDVVKSALGGADLMQFSRVRMQPGKPQGFGATPSGQLLFGLPGNPVSTAVSWEVFVRPALQTMQGRAAVHRRVVRVAAADGWRSPAGRRQYVPVSIDTSDPGAWLARPASSGHSGSHLVGSLALADGYAVVPAEVEAVEVGELVDVMLVT